MSLRSRTGASILAIRRAQQLINEPNGQTVLEAGDVVVLAGSHAAVDEAQGWLRMRDEIDEDAPDDLERDEEVQLGEATDRTSGS